MNTWPQVRTRVQMSSNPRFCCPVHLGVMTMPCTTPCGHTFDLSSIRALLDAGSSQQSSYSYYGGGSNATKCPTCRAIIPASWTPVVNYDLKGIIEDAMSVQTPPTAEVTSVHTEARTPPSATTRHIIDNKAHVQISVPADTPPLPLNIIAVIDCSGSMSLRATEEKPGQDSEGSATLSRVDLTRQSLRSIINSMSDPDTLTLVGFSTLSETFMQPTAMTATGKASAMSNVLKIIPAGGTSFWAGLRAGFKALEVSALKNPEANNIILFQTDGESDAANDPPRGILGEIRHWKEHNPTIKFTLQTIGYGYGEQLQSSLLREISRIGEGDFYYVPDGYILSQVMIHLFANLATVTHTHVSVSLTGCAETAVSVGFLQAGQTRDVILTQDLTSAVSSVSLCVRGKEVLKKMDVFSGPTVSDDSVGDALAHDVLKHSLCSAVHSGVLNVGLLKTSLSALSQTPYIRALQADVSDPDPQKGQIEKAFSPQFYQKWGKHFAPSICSSHMNQWGANFRDASSTIYGSAVTKDAIERVAQIYDSLPPIVPSCSHYHYSSSSSSSSSASVVSAPIQTSSHRPGCTCSACGRGGCFTGDTPVHTVNGVRQMQNIQAGDLLVDPLNPGKTHTVKCVVEYRVTQQIPVVYIGKAGFTEFHPIIDPIKGEWVHPKTCAAPVAMSLGAVYNLVLESGHIILCDKTFACTLAHTFEGPVISHSYFGKPVPGKPHCLEDLKKAAGWADGYVICKNTREIRNDSGEIEQLVFDT